MDESTGAAVGERLQDLAEGVERMADQRAGDMAERIERIEAEPGFDQLAERVGGAMAALLPNDSVERLLSGEWLGHPLHPALTDVPIGSWSSATLVDLFGGARHRRVAQGLTVLGLVAAVPTAAAGVAEFRKIEDAGTRRVAVAHMSCNAIATGLYALTLVTRPKLRVVTCALMVGAGTLGSIGGWLGGHLAFARGAGSRSGGSRPSDRGPDSGVHDYETASQPIHGISEEVTGETPAPGTTSEEFLQSAFVGE